MMVCNAYKKDFAIPEKPLPNIETSSRPVFTSYAWRDEIFRTQIENFLTNSANIYPDIDLWWKKKVIPGLQRGDRFCEVALVGNNIAGLSIGKFGSSSSKLCTLQVSENYNSMGIGHTLLNTALNRLISFGSKRVHYTISEEIYEKCGGFFESYNFFLNSWEKNRYVKGNDEMVFSSKSHILSKLLPYIADEQRLKSLLLISVKPEYATKIEQGEKLVEFRRKFATCSESMHAFFYVSSPTKEIRFSACIDKVIKDQPTCLWETYGNVSGIDKERFSEYFSTINAGYALPLSQVGMLSNPISLSELRSYEPSFTPPQSYCWLRKNGNSNQGDY
jgi:predicted transcriptional regulator/ribosomal protein S18 acetylase RimI-like enzyme